jgi:RNA polymerase sigma-70 factor (ECF subfamily)
MDPILYIEDEEDYQLLAQRILAPLGHPLIMADTGARGLALLAERPPSLLMLDINLPDTDGYTICSDLRKESQWAELPILMLTVRRRPEEWLRGFSSGADDYVAKPINPPELIDRVKTLLEGKGRRSTTSGTPEYQLIQSALAGNRAAYEVLIKQYQTRLIDSLHARLSNRTEAEDIVAQAFARAYERLDTFQGLSSFYTWIYRIALNEMHHRTRTLSPVSLDTLTSRDTATPSSLLDDKSLIDESTLNADVLHIQKVIHKVPLPYRKLLHWHDVEDLPYKTIAKKLGVPPGTVMSRLFKARQLLRKAWAKR